jgi:hypothetical protein
VRKLGALAAAGDRQGPEPVKQSASLTCEARR